MTKLEKVKNKIIELVPDIIVNKNAQLIKFDHSVEYFEQRRPITLEDVLRAIGGEQIDGIFLPYDNKVGITATGNFFTFDVDSPSAVIVWEKCKWNFGKPLDDQPKEVINFLEEVLTG